MKFMCLGYGDPERWESLSKSEQDAVIDESFDYDELLLKQGHWVDGGAALQAASTAKILRRVGGKVLVTDGPFAETKEQLGGVGVMEARDMDQAVELVSKHPGLRLGGPFEIRPLDEEALKRHRELDEMYRPDGNLAPRAEAGTARFASMGYVNERVFEGRTPAEFETMMQECLAFDEARRRAGQWLGGMALQGPQTAKTVRRKQDKVIVTDGPYAEAKEWIGGLVVLRHQNLASAVELLTDHPALRYGVAMEIRPLDEQLSARWETREHRAKRGMHNGR
jgi:hypothetical protein